MSYLDSKEYNWVRREIDEGDRPFSPYLLVLHCLHVVSVPCGIDAGVTFIHPLSIRLAHFTSPSLPRSSSSQVGIAEIPSVGGKVKRLLGQFTPYTWMRYEWHAAEDLKRFG